MDRNRVAEAAGGRIQAAVEDGHTQEEAAAAGAPGARRYSLSNRQPTPRSRPGIKTACNAPGWGSLCLAGQSDELPGKLFEITHFNAPRLRAAIAVQGSGYNHGPSCVRGAAGRSVTVTSSERGS